MSGVFCMYAKHEALFLVTKSTANRRSSVKNQKLN